MSRKYFFCTMLFLSVAIYSMAQTDTMKRMVAIKPAMTSQLRVIPSAKTTIVRKDAVQLKLQLSQFQDSVTVLKKDIDNAVDQIKNKLDSKSEMGETESLRLQMAMDRMSKMMSTLSNLLKKISETSQSITQNLK
jgi:predicted  nucleic acid-binding Zn-ribbon protein